MCTCMYLYMAHMTLFCMTNTCGNLGTKWSLIVCIALIIVILVSSGDPLPFKVILLIRGSKISWFSVRWQMKKKMYESCSFRTLCFQPPAMELISKK